MMIKRHSQSNESNGAGVTLLNTLIINTRINLCASDARFLFQKLISDVRLKNYKNDQKNPQS